MTEETSLTKLLLNYRILNKLTQAQMSVAIQCTQSQYSLWESGKKRPGHLREKSIREIIREYKIEL